MFCSINFATESIEGLLILSVFDNLKQPIWAMSNYFLQQSYE